MAGARDGRQALKGLLIPRRHPPGSAGYSNMAPVLGPVQYIPDLNRKCEALVAKRNRRRVALTVVRQKLLVLANYAFPGGIPHLEGAGAGEKTPARPYRHPAALPSWV